MKLVRSAAALCQLAILFGTGGITLAQRAPEVRRAQPVDEPPPVRRAVPLDESAAPAPYSAEQTPEPARPETEAPDRRQLDYANGLFTRKLYDLAAPEYQKYLDQYPRTCRIVFTEDTNLAAMYAATANGTRFARLFATPQITAIKPKVAMNSLKTCAVPWRACCDKENNGSPNIR